MKCEIYGPAENVDQVLLYDDSGRCVAHLEASGDRWELTIGGERWVSEHDGRAYRDDVAVCLDLRAGCGRVTSSWGVDLAVRR